MAHILSQSLPSIPEVSGVLVRSASGIVTWKTGVVRVAGGGTVAVLLPVHKVRFEGHFAI